ncbi:MAG: polyphosphate kinase 1 [Planctomycetota bacterium]|nr:MAG: polyphosphate kinase 1 [Planctomycetota bacterium]
MPGGVEYKPEHFINRELSWLEFNARVLEEAQDPSNPLLERVKFLAIFSSNLDEFFMVRVAGLREQAFGGVAPQDVAADGLDALTQLQRISQRVRELVDQQCRCWNKQIVPALAEQGVHLVRECDFDKSQRRIVDDFFRQRAFPILTPMAIDPSHPSPRFHNRGLYLAASLKRVSGWGPTELFAVVQLPQVLPRFIDVGAPNENTFVLLEDIIACKLPDLFGGYASSHHAAFRLTRDMDVDLLEQEGDDMLRAIESRLRARQHSEAVRLEVQHNMNRQLLDMLVSEEQLQESFFVDGEKYSEVYRVDGMLDLTALGELARIPGKDALRDPAFVPRPSLGLRRGDQLFSVIADRDVLLHHPFDSFDPVVDFIQSAAEDPHVLAIKQTLYRTSGDSPIVKALMQAAENGKHVTALVELKARFDEANNISWSRQMERAGVHVVYGFMDLKTHCKLAMVVRQEGTKVRRYVHLGTGNYNPTTARLYTDLGLFTSNKLIADDCTALFNFLTGYSQGHEWKKLVVAPQDLQQRTIELINQQAARARDGKSARIFAKLNSLVDGETIEALYDASQAGVPIDLVIRGICCLRPGLPRISENIRVRSIVDRFLEHSRIIVFGEGAKCEVYLSSADWMPRNFERRVEVMFPIEAPELRRRIGEEIIPAYLHDNCRARVLMPDGAYVRAAAWHDEPPRRAQRDLLAAAGGLAARPTFAAAVNGQPAADGEAKGKHAKAR